MKVDVTAFSGETPRAADNVLSGSDATTAENCKLEKGDLRSWNESSTEEDLSLTTVKSLFEYDGSFLVDEDDLDYVFSAIANDPYDRLYFTGKSEPRVYSSSVAMPGYYKLGVPAADVQPEAAVNTAGSGSNEERSYAYTRMTSHLEEGPPCPITDFPVTPFKDDDVVNITKIEAIPSDRLIVKLRLYRTVAGSDNVAEYQWVKDYTLPTIAVFESGVTTADDGEYYSFDDGTNDLIYKCVNDGTTCDPDDATNGVGGTGTAYWEYYTLVDDVDTADLDDSGLVCPSETFFPPPAAMKGLRVMENGTYIGFVGNELYGSVQQLAHAWPDVTEKFHNDIVGVETFGNFILVTLSGEGKPALMYGDTFGTMQRITYNDTYPNVQKRSMAGAKSGCFYCSNEGLIFVDQNGPKNVTIEKVTVEEWQAINPSNINGQFYGDKYFGFSTDTDSGSSFIYDFITGNFTRLPTEVYASHVSGDDGQMYIVEAESLVPNDPETETVLRIKQWEGDEYNYKRYYWRSIRFMLGAQVNFSVARVMLDDSFYSMILESIGDDEYLITLNQDMIDDNDLRGGLDESEIDEFEINGDALYTIATLGASPAVEFCIYTDGEATPRFIKSVKSSKPFKLKAGFKPRQVEFSLSGFTPVSRVTIATGMRELF